MPVFQKDEEKPAVPTSASTNAPVDPKPERVDPNAVLEAHAAGKDDRCVNPKCHGEQWPCPPAASAKRLQSLGA